MPTGNHWMRSYLLYARFTDTLYREKCVCIYVLRKHFHSGHTACTFLPRSFCENRLLRDRVLSHPYKFLACSSWKRPKISAAYVVTRGFAKAARRFARTLREGGAERNRILRRIARKYVTVDALVLGTGNTALWPLLGSCREASHLRFQKGFDSMLNQFLSELWQMKCADGE